MRYTETLSVAGLIDFDCLLIAGQKPSKRARQLCGAAAGTKDLSDKGFAEGMIQHGWLVKSSMASMPEAAGSNWCIWVQPPTAPSVIESTSGDSHSNAPSNYPVQLCELSVRSGLPPIWHLFGTYLAPICSKSLFGPGAVCLWPNNSSEASFGPKRQERPEWERMQRTASVYARSRS